MDRTPLPPPPPSSERRAAALALQLETRRMFERFKARLEHVKGRPTPAVETDVRRRLWLETALVGGGGGMLTFGALRSSKVGRGLAALGGVLNSQVFGAVFFASRAPKFFEDIVAQPERSPFVDDALCPTLVDFRRITQHEDFAPVFQDPNGDAPPIAPLVSRMWALCDKRTTRFQGETDAFRADAAWGARAPDGDDGWATDAAPPASEQEWYTPPAASDAWGDDPPPR